VTRTPYNREKSVEKEEASSSKQYPGEGGTDGRNQNQRLGLFQYVQGYSSSTCLLQVRNGCMMPSAEAGAEMFGRQDYITAYEGNHDHPLLS
ncbi:hypothetical protein C5167_030099, partial [Papaver somniferum]